MIVRSILRMMVRPAVVEIALRVEMRASLSRSVVTLGTILGSAITESLRNERSKPLCKGRIFLVNMNVCSCDIGKDCVVTSSKSGMLQPS